MAFAAAKLNGDYYNLGTLGVWKARAVKMTFASLTYATGGVDLSADVFENDFGIKHVIQMIFLRVQADDTAGLVGVGAQWDTTNKKLLLYGGGVASDPAQVPNTTDIASLEIDAIILGRS